MGPITSDILGDALKLRALLVFAMTAAALAGCAAEPPPVSDKVQQAYDSIGKATLPAHVKGKAVAFIGDSYTLGTGASVQSLRWTTRLSGAEDWSESNFGQGGTGYAMSDTANGPLRQVYSASIPEVVKSAPEVVVVSGGRNDSPLPAATVTAAITDFYTKLHAALPSAKIIAVSPVWDASAPPQNLSLITSSVKASVEGVGGTYLDIGQPLAGHPELISDDKVHPNDAGAKALADATAAALLKSPAAAIAKG